MPTFVVRLSGHQDDRDDGIHEPERTGELTVDAKDPKDAAAFAEQQNPGLKVVGTPEKLS